MKDPREVWLKDLGIYDSIRRNKILYCANYIIEYDMTIREVAQEMCISRTSVYRYVTDYLKHIDDDLYIQVKNILKKHRRLEHDRTGKFKKCH